MKQTKQIIGNAIKSYPDIKCDSFVGNDVIGMRPSSGWFAAKRFTAVTATVRSIHVWQLLNFNGIVCKSTAKITLHFFFISLSFNKNCIRIVWFFCCCWVFAFELMFEWPMVCTNQAHSRAAFQFRNRVIFTFTSGRYRITCTALSNQPYRIFAFQYISFLSKVFFFFCFRFWISSLHLVVLKLNHTKFHVFKPK